MNDRWIPPLLAIIALVAGIAIALLKSFTLVEFFALTCNLEGTVLLASAFSANIPLHGKTVWDNLKWATTKLHEYSSPLSFNIFRFYAGLTLLLIGIIASAAIKK